MTKINRSGYIAIVGRPNVGKSTLLNTLLGEKLSITSPKPQTTRWQVLGVKVHNDAQFIYIDTPGINDQEKRAMNRYLNRVASAVLDDADVILFVVDSQKFNREDEMVLQKLRGKKAPVYLVINKIDLVKDKAKLLPLIDKLKNLYDFSKIIPISARNKLALNQLEDSISEDLPEGPMLFPEDQVTDKSKKFQIAEIIRERLIYATGDELPYTTTVEIEQFKEDKKVPEIAALIWVERQGQKAIVIGKKGEVLKKIGMESRKEIEKLLGKKVFLRLWVKVKSNWTDDTKALRGLGYE